MIKLESAENETMVENCYKGKPVSTLFHYLKHIQTET